MVNSFLNKISKFVYKRPWVVIVLALLLTVFMGLSASKLQFKSSFQDLLPDHFKSVKVLREVTEKIGGIGYVTLIINTDNIVQGEKYTAAIAREIEKIPEIRFVDYRLNVEYFRKNALLYLDLEDLKDVHERFKKKRDYEKKVMNPFYIDLENKKSDLNFDDILEKYRKKNINTNENGYYVAKDKKRILLLAKPKGLATDLNYAKKVVKDVQLAVAKVDPKKYHKSINVEYTDRYVIMPLQNAAIKVDLKNTSLLSFLGVVLLITFYTRRKRAVALIGIPLIMGVMWAFGLAYLTIGYVNLVTGFLMAILLGLGIDFGIHLFSRYLLDRKNGLDLQKTIDNVICQTGRASFTAAITSAVAFFALIFTEFRGFSEFGKIAGAGLMTCYFAMLTVLPALMVIFDKWFPIKVVEESVESKNSLMNLKKYISPRIIVIVSVVLLLVSAGNIYRMKFEYNFKNLQVRDLPELALQDVANETMGISLTPNAILAKDYNEVKEITNILETHKKELIKEGKGSTIDKVASLLTSIPENQNEKMKIVSKIRGISKDKVFKYLRGKQARMFKKVKEVLNPEYITLENLPIEVKRLFTGVDNSKTYLMWVFPGVLLWNGKEAIRFVNEIRYVNRVKEEPIDISGETFIMADMLELIKKDGILAILLTLFTVFMILLLDFKNFYKALLVMSPLVVGVFFMFGTMVLFGIKINFLNVIMFPVIIGLGVDNGVHIYHRYQELNYSKIGDVIRSTGSAVLLSSLTTMIGFGSLMIARHKGLNSIGLLAVIGIACCLLTSTILFPSILYCIKKRKNKILNAHNEAA